MEDNRFYVYQLIDPRNNEVFYVGKGTGYRMTGHLTEAKQPKIKWSNAIKCERINSIWNSGCDVICHKTHTDLTENDACNIEASMMAQYGFIIHGGQLTNVSQHNMARRHGDTKRNTRQISQYTKNGVFVATYPSANAAAARTGVRSSGILDTCKHNINTAGGFRWCYADEPLADWKVSKHTERRKPVAQIDDAGHILQVWDSPVLAARALDLCATHIRQCCVGKKYHNTAGGFMWKYVDQKENQPVDQTDRHCTD